VRDELGARPDEVVVLALGALVRRKGFDLLLEALRRIQRRPLVWIAGEGPERAALERQIGGLAGRARLLGRREDVPDLLGAIDLVAMPSRAEGLGVAALEAMAAGRALVAARVGGLAELVVDGRTALLVPPEDPGALAEAIKRLAEDAGLCARLGAAGPGRVAEGHLASQMVAAYRELYRQVLELAAEREGVARG
jgi:glycosyltransferase involved in cell wall biosynthesis